MVVVDLVMSSWLVVIRGGEKSTEEKDKKKRLM